MLRHAMASEWVFPQAKLTIIVQPTAACAGWGQSKITRLDVPGMLAGSGLYAVEQLDQC